MTIKEQLIYRPQALPSPGVPLGARSVGANRVSAGYVELRPPRPMVQVFWFARGKGCVRIHETVHRVRGTALVVYGPETPHELRAESVDWSWRYWTMDGPMAYRICEDFGLSEGPHPAGPVPHATFLRLAEALRDLSAEGERRAGALAYELLSRAALPRPAAHPAMVERALRYLDGRWCDPACSVQAMAAELGVDRSQLTRRFSESVGMSPVRYLTAKRIQHAQTLLNRREHAVAAVAQASGFSDPSYFTRVFRQYCGRTPMEFRRYR